MIKSHKPKKICPSFRDESPNYCYLGAKGEYINHCIKSARKRNGNCLHVGTNDRKYESRPTEI